MIARYPVCTACLSWSCSFQAKWNEAESDKAGRISEMQTFIRWHDKIRWSANQCVSLTKDPSTSGSADSHQRTPLAEQSLGARLARSDKFKACTSRRTPDSEDYTKKLTFQLKTLFHQDPRTWAWWVHCSMHTLLSFVTKQITLSYSTYCSLFEQLGNATCESRWLAERSRRYHKSPD